MNAADMNCRIADCPRTVGVKGVRGMCNAHYKAERRASYGSQFSRLDFTPQPWTDEAACRNTIEPDAWHPDGYSTPAIRAQVAHAKYVCERCPVRLQCLTYALEVDANTSYRSEGIWGGLTGPERDRLRKGEAAA